ncbi:hypothetical protein [Floridanema evergladense]|uniref:Uncharacterized protein n=1 Tax=Floridaenema evergladense BLCC-F167 TaxID=3153639 RepID=A0ABV4WD14_9CYAN
MTFLPAKDIEGELIEIRYIPLSALEENIDNYLMKGNPKKHDVGLLSQSIIKNGFVDPPKWDTNLNGGKGGFVFGNGRTYTAVETLRYLQGQKQPPPKGIGIIKKTGEWAIPVKFGCDADSELAAKKFGLDHNLLTMAGGEYTPFDMSRMFEKDLLIDQLDELLETEEPLVTFDLDDTKNLIDQLNKDFENANEDDIFNDKANDNSKFPLPIVLDWNEYQQWKNVKEKLGLKKDKLAFLKLIEQED